MSINFENLDSYEALEEILNWKRNKSKRIKTKDRIDVEINKRKLFKKLEKWKTL